MKKIVALYLLSSLLKMMASETSSIKLQEYSSSYQKAKIFLANTDDDLMEIFESSCQLKDNNKKKNVFLFSLEKKNKDEKVLVFTCQKNLVNRAGRKSDLFVFTVNDHKISKVKHEKIKILPDKENKSSSCPHLSNHHEKETPSFQGHDVVQQKFSGREKKTRFWKAPKTTSKWTMNDSIFEAVYLTTHIIDWGQTLNISENCESGRYTGPI